MKKILAVGFICGLSMCAFSSSSAQVKWVIGGNMGMSITTGGGGSNVAFTFGPMGEVLLNKNIAIGSEFDINTSTGTPVTWADYFKYYFSVPGSKIRPYADGGFGLVFATGGPYFGIIFGGGASFPVGRNLYIAPELQLGPVFGFKDAANQSLTLFNIVFRGGIRYEIP